MPIRIVLDPPRRFVLRAPRETARTLVGGLLLLVGLVASAPAFPLTIAVTILFASAVGGSAESADSLRKLPVAEILQVWAASLALAVGGSYLGLKLLRGKRQLVLFLRRFGFDEAQVAVTFAASSSIGRAWRLVTLDDHEVAPLGVPITTQRLFRLVGLGGHAAGGLDWLFQALPRVAGVAWAGMLGIIAIDAIGKPDVGSALLGSASKHMDLIASAVKSGAIVYPFGPDLPSAFLVLTGVVAVSVLIAVIAIPIYVLTILLAIPIGFISSSAEAVRKAEESKRRTIDDPREVDQLARTLAHESRSIFAPRLVVLTVAASSWRYTVASLAAVSSAILIDISEPTENLLWEISELREQFGSRFLVVGDYDRLLQLESLATSAPESISARLVALLDGQQVLAYSADGRGMRRFGRALRDRLETLPTQAVG